MNALTKVILILVLVFHHLPNSILAQAPDTLWTRIYGGEESDAGYAVEQTSDSGFIVTGSTVSYGAGDGDVWLIKMDENGRMVWDKTFGGSSGDGGFSVQQTADRGYIIVGFTGSFGGNYADVYLIKTDENGEEIWSNTFDRGNFDWGQSVQQTSDGGYIIAGRTRPISEENYDVLLIKTDESGSEIWSKTFGGLYEDQGSMVQQTSDSGYIIVGDTKLYSGSNSDVWLIKADVDGNEEWNKTFGGTLRDGGNSVQKTIDGGYIIAGRTWSFGAGMHDVWLIKTDAYGNEEWNKTFGGSGMDVGNSVHTITELSQPLQPNYYNQLSNTRIKFCYD